MKHTVHFIFSITTLCLLIVGCKKDDVEERVIEYGTLQDIDGNTYRTVKIGDSWWMAENLRVTHFNDGTDLQEFGLSVEEDSLWERVNAPAYSSVNDSLYGLLYNGYVLNVGRNIAPEGWHVPSDAEWMELERELGMNEAEAEGLARLAQAHEDVLRAIAGHRAWIRRYGVVVALVRNHSETESAPVSAPEGVGRPLNAAAMQTLIATAAIRCTTGGHIRRKADAVRLARPSWSSSAARDAGRKTMTAIAAAASAALVATIPAAASSASRPIPAPFLGCSCGVAVATPATQRPVA